MLSPMYVAWLESFDLLKLVLIFVILLIHDLFPCSAVNLAY